MLTDEQLDELESHYGWKIYNRPRTLENFSRGLMLLKDLSEKKEYCLQGEHDTIYVFAGPPTSDGQQIELDKLGFRYDEDLESWRYHT